MKGSRGGDAAAAEEGDRRQRDRRRARRRARGGGIWESQAVVRLLLGKRANVNAVGEEYGSALQAAA